MLSVFASKTSEFILEEFMVTVPYFIVPVTVLISLACVGFVWVITLIKNYYCCDKPVIEIVNKLSDALTSDINFSSKLQESEKTIPQAVKIQEFNAVEEYNELHWY
jgi:hypothetical protein